MCLSLEGLANQNIDPPADYRFCHLVGREECNAQVYARVVKEEAANAGAGVRLGREGAEADVEFAALDSLELFNIAIELVFRRSTYWVPLPENSQRSG